jgi:hypothetical protein
MIKFPRFRPFGEGDERVSQSIQPGLELRPWSALKLSEKQTAIQALRQRAVLLQGNFDLYRTIFYLNDKYLRLSPGHRLFGLPAYADMQERLQASTQDFEELFLNAREDLVFVMLSKFLEYHIDEDTYKAAIAAEDEALQTPLVEQAFQRFDRVALQFNHVFEQFAVNQLVTRNGLVPRQDDRIASELYEPVLKILAAPKWKPVSADLSNMFHDYRERRYSEVITKAHTALQRFFQILVGQEGKSGKGELGKLFAEARARGILPSNRFSEAFIGAFQSFIPSERATNSTAKPSVKDATASEALLLINTVMVLIQFCLANLRN